MTQAQKTLLVLGSDKCCEEMLERVNCHIKLHTFCNWKIVVDGRNAISAEAFLLARAAKAQLQVVSKPAHLMQMIGDGDIDRVLLLEMPSDCNARLAAIEDMARRHGVHVIPRFFG